MATSYSDYGADETGQGGAGTSLATDGWVDDTSCASPAATSSTALR